MVLGIHSYTSQKLGVLGSFQSASSPVVYAMVKVARAKCPYYGQPAPTEWSAEWLWPTMRVQWALVGHVLVGVQCGKGAWL